MACAGLPGACSTGPGLPGLAVWLRYLAWGSRGQQKRGFGFADVLISAFHYNIVEEYSSTIFKCLLCNNFPLDGVILSSPRPSRE